MNLSQAKRKLLADTKIRKAYQKIDLGYEIGIMVSDARLAKNMTQSQLAEVLGTKQPAIARLERGGYIPSLTLLQRIAKVFNTRLLPPRFESMLDKETKNFVINTRDESRYEGIAKLSALPNWDLNNIHHYTALSTNKGGTIHA